MRAPSATSRGQLSWHQCPSKVAPLWGQHACRSPSQAPQPAVPGTTPDHQHACCCHRWACSLPGSLGANPTHQQAESSQGPTKRKGNAANKDTLGAVSSDDEGIVPVGPTGHLLHKAFLSRPRDVADLPTT